TGYLIVITYKPRCESCTQDPPARGSFLFLASRFASHALVVLAYLVLLARHNMRRLNDHGRVIMLRSFLVGGRHQAASGASSSSFCSVMPNTRIIRSLSAAPIG